MFAIDTLSRTEKLQMMEALWRDLSANVHDVPSPAWHIDALRQAETAASSGTAHMVDWDEAKTLLRQRPRS